MKYFLAASLLAYIVAALANSSRTLAGKNTYITKKTANHYTGTNNNNVMKAQSDMINNYYVGPHCKKIEHQLTEIKQEVRALKENHG